MKIKNYKLDVRHWETIQESIVWFSVDGDSEAIKLIAQKLELIIKELNQ